MSRPELHAKAQRFQQRNLSDALATLRRAGIPEQAVPLRALNREAALLRTKFGLRVARGVVQLLRLVGLSPGSITVFFDTENGWFSMARARPGAPPVYKLISAETAIAILKGELTHELEAWLLTPEEVFVA